MKAALAILGAAAALVAVARLVHDSPVPPSSPRVSAVGSPVVRREARRERDGGPVRSFTPPEATDTARRFLAAYLRWQNGHREPRMVMTLRRTASPALWRQLNSGAGLPSSRSAVPVERLRSLVAGNAGTNTAATLLAQLNARRRIGTLAMVVRRRANGWRVTSLTP